MLQQYWSIIHCAVQATATGIVRKEDSDTSSFLSRGQDDVCQFSRSREYQLTRAAGEDVQSWSHDSAYALHRYVF